MTPKLLTFSVNAQALVKTGGPDQIAGGTRGYIKAQFDLTGIWGEFETVLAIWKKDGQTITAELDAEGKCDVPDELLQTRGKVSVNLVHAIKTKSKVIYRLTSYPAEAVTISETVPT